MAGARTDIRIEIDDADVRAMLREALARVENLRPAMREIGEVLLSSTKDRFADTTGPDGQRWAENRATTLARKSGTRPLTDSGILGGTIAYQLDPSGNAVSIGTNRIYGAMQQFGGTRQMWPHLWGDIPPRPFLGISTDDRDQILTILRDHLTRP